MVEWSQKDRAISLKIYYSDTDAGGVVYYANYLVFFEKARTEWLKEMGLDVKELADKGVLFAISECSVRYKAPARLGDVVDVYLKLVKVRPVRLFFLYVVKKGDVVLTEAETTMVCLNKEFKPVPIPDSLLKVFEDECTS